MGLYANRALIEILSTVGGKLKEKKDRKRGDKKREDKKEKEKKTSQY
ncbi:MAG: hypothetical protein NC432_14515 [Roseburia sp.]|nr:hypothetical protein [Roseburia sp.]MCM1096810.1 hypothetical protein [Ruminococcus flavefaciens]